MSHERVAGRPVAGPPPSSSAFATPGSVWIDESTTLRSGVEIVTFQIFGDDDGDATPPPAGSFGPLFTNSIDTVSEDVFVNFGLDAFFWSGVFSSSGDFALVQTASFTLFFGGGFTNPVGITPVSTSTFGDGTEDSKLNFQAQFDPLDFAGNPTAFQASLSIVHVPEPATLALLGGGLLILAARR